MKFGDKLVALRKKNGLSQEELAAKLNVSRQSVSKWESNNSYPETDKIVQICNLFDCSMDDLINDNIKNIESIERKNKNNINMVIDSFLEFITKTINMFCDMKFISGLKCIIEMVIMAFILFLGGLLFVNLIKYIILNLFSFVPKQGYYILSNMCRGFLSMIWFVFELIVLVHIFKIRYLNYYDKAIIKNEDEKKEKVKIDKKETIVIRDEKHKPFAFLSVCSKVIIFFIKLFVVFLGIFFCALLVSFVVMLIISLSLSIYSTIFVGIDLALLSTIIVDVLILILSICFIFEKKVNYKIMLVTFLISIFICGIGIGISVISFKNINIKDNISDIVKLSIKNESIEFDEDLVIKYDNIEYIIDNNRKNIDIEIEYDERFNLYQLNNYNYYGLKLTDIYIFDSANIKNIYNVVIDDLKHNVLRVNYDNSNIYVKIYASEDNINKIIDNTKKVYLMEIKKTDNGYILYNFKNRIDIYSECEIEYNAKLDKFETYDKSCKCTSNEVNNKIELTCSY